MPSKEEESSHRAQRGPAAARNRLSQTRRRCRHAQSGALGWSIGGLALVAGRARPLPLLKSTAGPLRLCDRVRVEGEYRPGPTSVSGCTLGPSSTLISRPVASSSYANVERDPFGMLDGVPRCLTSSRARSAVCVPAHESAQREESACKQNNQRNAMHPSSG